MSFSSEVKEELLGRIGSSRHCQLAEIAAIIDAAGLIETGENGAVMLFLQDDDAFLPHR